MLRNTVKLLINCKQTAILKNPKELNVNSIRNIKRWVAPTLRELQHRRTKFKSIIYTARNTFPEWNYNAEIFAFGKRLNEDFRKEYLQTAFIDPSYIVQEEVRQKNLGIETPLNMTDNINLIQVGQKCISDYVQSYLKFSLPECSPEGILKIFDWLTSEEILANISLNIGTKDLILCADNNPSKTILRNVFVAVIGALNESSGEESAYNFIRDFLCTQLNQKDLTEIWQIENALEKLKKKLNEKGLGEPEPRLLGQNGLNTVLATYYVGIYENKRMIGKGFGESINIAIQSASLDALYKLYGIHPSQKMFNFDVQLESANKKEPERLQKEN